MNELWIGEKWEKCTRSILFYSYVSFLSNAGVNGACAGACEGRNLPETSHFCLSEGNCKWSKKCASRLPFFTFILPSFHPLILIFPPPHTSPISRPPSTRWQKWPWVFIINPLAPSRPCEKGNAFFLNLELVSSCVMSFPVFRQGVTR